MEDLDFSGLEGIFSERFLQMMLRRGKILPETAEVMRSWKHSGFNVGWRERKLEADDRQGLQGLLSYMERVPVSLRRLRYRDQDGLVQYQGTRVHPRLGVDHQILEPVEALATLVPHILLRYQVTTRLYGAISTRSRQRLGWIQHPPTRNRPRRSRPASHRSCPLPPSHAPPSPPNNPPRPRSPQGEAQDDSPWLRARRRSWARLIHRTWLCDPELCPVCGQRMKVVAAITSPAQDDVIEKILRHINRWNPPWQSQRRARGPPQAGVKSCPGGRRSDASEFSDRLPADEDYAVDPLAPDDFA